MPTQLHAGSLWHLNDHCNEQEDWGIALFYEGRRLSPIYEQQSTVPLARASVDGGRLFSSA
jgi:hypothetical protein